MSLLHLEEFFLATSITGQSSFFFHFDITSSDRRERGKFSSDHSLLIVSGAGGHVSTSNVEFHLSKGLVVEQSIHLCICICRMRWQLGCVRPSALEGRRICLTRYITIAMVDMINVLFGTTTCLDDKGNPPFFLFFFFSFLLISFWRGSVYVQSSRKA